MKHLIQCPERLHSGYPKENSTDILGHQNWTQKKSENKNMAKVGETWKVLYK